MNFGEEIAYWYLRFNGFFPLTNFVLHRREHANPSDCDLLAVRPPFVTEETGGNPWDWDPDLQPYWANGCTVGVIGEVKSGQVVGDIFRPDYVRTALKRLGFVSEEREFEEALQAVQRQPSVEIGQSHRVVKVLFANHSPGQSRGFHCILLRHARDFIRARLAAYSEKQSDWVYFNSHLIQYLAWDTKWGKDEPGG